MGKQDSTKGDQKAKGNTRAKPNKSCHLGFSSEMLIGPNEGSVKQLMFYYSMGIRIWLNQLQSILLSCGGEGNADVFSGNDEVRRSFRV